jgi:hypothetical protein
VFLIEAINNLLRKVNALTHTGRGLWLMQAPARLHLLAFGKSWDPFFWLLSALFTSWLAGTSAVVIWYLVGFLVGLPVGGHFVARLLGRQGGRLRD